jgi:hypothetical protein
MAAHFTPDAAPSYAASHSIHNPHDPPTPQPTSTNTPLPTNTSTPLATSTPVSSPPPAAVAGSYAFGTLVSDSTKAAGEYTAGLRVEEMEIAWANYEPSDGVFSNVTSSGSYAYQAKQHLQAFQAAGMKVILGIGLQYPPAWVFSYANSHYVNQFGGQATSVNLIFNATLRAKAAAYIARVNQDLGLNNFWAVRVGSGGWIETLYPDESADGMHTNGYWGYDANAQGTGGNLPSTVPANPFPGWKPGQTTYNGQPFSTAQVSTWIHWYLGALMDAVNWQIQTYRSLGYNGFIHVLMPGLGARPDEWTNAINGYLGGAGDTNLNMGRGAVWFQDMPMINPKQNVVLDIPSVDDSSSFASGGVNNLCQSTDSAVALTDPRIDYWSSTRELAYLANRNGLPTIGENPAYNPYGAQMISDAATLMQSCKLTGLLWAFDSRFYDGTSGYTLSDYAAVIAQYPH